MGTCWVSSHVQVSDTSLHLPHKATKREESLPATESSQQPLRQTGDCRGLDEMCPHSLQHLNTWFILGGAVWEGLGGGTLLEEVHFRGGGVE